MNRRTPTAGEAHYEKLCRFSVGCIACILQGRGPEQQNPNESFIAFHHDPKFGSRKPDCHYHAFGLCEDHHQGVNLPPGSPLPVRHGSESRFRQVYGPDTELCKISWMLVSAMDIGHRLYSGDQDVLKHCPFDEYRRLAA